MNIERDLDDFRFREPPPFLRENIKRAVNRNAATPPRPAFWPVTGVAAALLLLLAITTTTLDRHLTQQTVGHTNPPGKPVAARAQEPEPTFARGPAPGLTWDRHRLAHLYSGRTDGDTSERMTNHDD